MLPTAKGPWPMLIILVHDPNPKHWPSEAATAADHSALGPRPSEAAIAAQQCGGLGGGAPPGKLFL